MKRWKGLWNEIFDLCFLSFEPPQAPDSSHNFFSILPSKFQSYFKFETTPRKYAPPVESKLCLKFYKNFSLMNAYIKGFLNLFYDFPLNCL